MLPGLLVKIGANTRDFDAKLGESNRKLAAFGKVAATAAVAVAGAMTALALKTMASIDTQAKLAQSLGTTVKSMQVLNRAADMAGLDTAAISMAMRTLVTRLSQASAGAGPAADALKALGLNANELSGMPLDDRMLAINEALDKHTTAASRAGVASALFGERAGLLIGRLDTATMRQAAQDIEDFGLAVSETDADNIEKANDSVTRLGMAWTGFSNRLAVAVAPAVDAIATALANVLKVGSAFSSFLEAVIGRIPAYVASVATFAVGLGAYTLAINAARIATIAWNFALGLTRAALIRTGIGALIVIIGELTFRVLQLAEKFGGLGNLVDALKTIFMDRFERMMTRVKLLSVAFALMSNEMKIKFQNALINMATSFFAFINDVNRGMNSLFSALNLPENVGASTLESMGEELGRVNSGFHDLIDLQHKLRMRLAEPAVTLDSLLEGVKQTTQELGSAGVGAGGAMENSLNAAGKAAGKLEDKLTDAQQQAKDLAETIASKVGDAFMSMVDGTKSAKDAFKQMALDIIKELYRIFVVKKITGFITTALSGGDGTIGDGAIAGVTPIYSGGGYTGNGSRTGGLDGQGGMLAVVHPKETIIDHTRPGGGSGGGVGGNVTVNQTINVETGVSQTVRVEMMQLMPRIVEAAKSGVLDASRRGGSFGAMVG